MSVNSSISDALDTEMISIKKWTGVLQWPGCPAERLKNDWNAAYKHQGVHPEDYLLQVIEWGGEVFFKQNRTEKINKIKINISISIVVIFSLYIDWFLKALFSLTHS